MLMASSKVMASRSQTNPDLPRQPSPSPLHIQSDHGRGFGSMNMEEIFKNIYDETGSFDIGDDEEGGGGGGSSAVDGGSHGGGVTNENKTVDEVWRDIVSGAVAGAGGSSGVDDGAGGGGGVGRMTLEDFLAKARALNEEEVTISAVGTIAPPSTATGAFGMEAMMNPATGVPVIQFAPAVCVQKGLTTGGFGVEFGNGGGNSSRGKRKAALGEVPLDKATQQKQRRMIKNRESAARSRERKQAYTVELESLVTQLEEDNARLLKEEAELMKERYKQLMTNLIPVSEKPRPPRILRRLRSMTW